MVKTFFPYIFTSTTVSSRQGSQKPSILWYCRTKSARLIQKDGFLAGWPAIFTIAKSSASIHLLPSNRHFSLPFEVASVTKQLHSPTPHSPTNAHHLYPIA